jgi:hypothetical protein
MEAIRDATQVEQCGRLLREMMIAEEDRETEFNSDWVRSHGWKVVPVPSMSRLPLPDIPRIVSVLNEASYMECLAIFNEPGYIQSLPVAVQSQPPSDVATCYRLSVDEADFRAFNRELGPYRSVLTIEDRAWAISCNEWYNLFAAEPVLLTALLGKPIDQARREFFEFVSSLAKGRTEDPLVQVARHYASL